MQFFDCWKFPTDEIMGAQTLNFAPKFPANWFLTPNCAFLDENFMTRTTFPDSQKFKGRGAIASPYPFLPPCHDATAYNM